jgi:hypothetical protein
LTTPIADEEPIEDSAGTQTSQTNTNRDVFVLDTSSLYHEKSLPPATRGRSLTPVVTPAEIRPVEIHDNPRSSAPASPTRTRVSTRSSTPVHAMQVDDDYDDGIYDGKSYDERYLTIKQFNYTMNLLDGKINSIYKLLRHVSDQQQKDSQTVQKLAVVDELSDEF